MKSPLHTGVIGTVPRAVGLVLVLLCGPIAAAGIDPCDLPPEDCLLITNCPGGTVNMTVNLAGGTFTWCCNGVLLPGETGDTLTTNLDVSAHGTVYVGTGTNAMETKKKCFEIVIDCSVPPILICPDDLVEIAEGPGGANVSFPISFGHTCGVIVPATIECDPPSGSLFPIGSTVVSCSVSDTCGNVAACAFTITVEPVSGTPSGFFNYDPGTHIPVGDPVSGFGGNHFLTAPPDLHLGGPGLPVFIQRHYDSRLQADGEVNSALGPNWQHNYDLSLSIDGTNATAVFREGRILQFGQAGTNWSLTGRADIPFRLVETGSGFLLADPRSQFMYSFSTNGLLVRIEDGRGNTNELSYSGALLTNVTDNLDRNLDFAYGAGDLLTNVTDRFRSVRFGFTGGLLISSVDALGHTTTYAYDPANTNNPALLTARTLPEGNTPVTSVYDAEGRVISQTDAAGQVVSIAYTTNAGQQVSTFTNAVGDTQVQTYNAAGELSQFIDEAGNTLGLTSDSSGRRTSASDREGGLMQIAYDAASGLPAAIGFPANADASFSYDSRTVNGVAFFDLVRAVQPDSTTNSYAYDPLGNVVSATNRVGDVTAYDYNGHGQVLSVTNPLGGRVEFAYDAQARLTSSTDSDIGVTTYAYDALNRLTNIARPGPGAVQLAYDAVDRLTSISDERTNSTAFQYDANGRLTNVVNALGQSTQFEYDGLNRLTRTVDRQGHSISYGYDPRATPQPLLATVTNRNGFVSRFAYDERVRLTELINPAGVTNQLAYDAEGRLTSATNPLGETFGFQRDPLGYVVAVTDPLGQASMIERDEMKRITRVTDPLSRDTTFSYDPRGLVTNVTSELGIRAGYRFNPIGLVTNIIDPIDSEWTFAYTDVGRPAIFSDPLGRETHHTYDTRGRVSRVTFADGAGLTNTYDEADNLTQINYSDGTVFQFAYDALDRITNAHQGADLSLSYDAMDRLINSRQAGINFGAAYDADGRLINVTYNGAQATVTYVYDQRDRLVQVSDDLTGHGADFSYDDANRLTGITRSNGVATTYAYDARGFVTRVQDGAFIDVQYTLDAAGQVTRADYAAAPIDPTTVVTNGSSGFTYDGASQITSAAYAYDTRGRLTNAPNASLQWDGASRLVGIEAVSLGYNAFSDVETRVAGGNTNRYFYNYAVGRSPFMADRQDNTGQFVRFYVWSPSGVLLYIINLPGNTVSYPHFDRVGSTLALTDAGGAVTDAYAYTPYGSLSSRTGTNAQPFQFVGRYGVRAEPAGDLVQMRLRYYAPHTAAFVSPEPRWPPSASPGKLNRYQYALRNPLSRIDPQGTDEELPDVQKMTTTELWNELYLRLEVKNELKLKRGTRGLSERQFKAFGKGFWEKYNDATATDLAEALDDLREEQRKQGYEDKIRKRMKEEAERMTYPSTPWWERFFQEHGWTPDPRFALPLLYGTSGGQRDALGHGVGFHYADRADATVSFLAETSPPVPQGQPGRTQSSTLLFATGNSAVGNYAEDSASTPRLPGDFNGDGVVDALDYEEWRERDRTAEGYMNWVENYGRTL